MGGKLEFMDTKKEKQLLLLHYIKAIEKERAIQKGIKETNKEIRQREQEEKTNRATTI